eukprot:1566497-Pleurochrysis_carterae.AAC.5
MSDVAYVCKKYAFFSGVDAELTLRNVRVSLRRVLAPICPAREQRRDAAWRAGARGRDCAAPRRAATGRRAPRGAGAHARGRRARRTSMRVARARVRARARAALRIFVLVKRLERFNA